MDQTTEKREYTQSSAAATVTVIEGVRQKRTYLIVKRAFDIIASATALVILSPVLLLIALIIKLDSPGPVIHKRWCVGRDKPYAMLKFRSMVADADDLEKYLTPEQIREYKTNIKLHDDPRITRIGRFLRKTSLDELLQLVNVLKGEMSIVGPRPVVKEELVLYGDEAEEILTAKPGITGYWQTHGRSDCTYESGERQSLELYYVHNQSVALDIRIMLKTVTVVVRRGGYVLESAVKETVTATHSQKTVCVLRKTLCFPVLLFAATSTAAEGGTAVKTTQAIARTEPGIVYRFLKRLFDMTVSVLGLIALSPLLLLIAVLIKLDSPGPVLHRRICVGKNDRPYTMYKFRSMKQNADELFDLFTPEQLEAYMSGVKIDGDPRITRIGRFLRRTSLDEIPQLISVLKGDMSLVGPRPVIEREAAEYGADRKKLLSCRAGITGCWQVEGRGTIPFLSEEAKHLQLYYVEHQSLGLDIRILFRTVKVVLSRKGAK